MTIKSGSFFTFIPLSTFKIISFNHNHLSLENIGLLHLNEEAQSAFLPTLKVNFELEELMLLSTCNRVEFFLLCSNKIDHTLLLKLLRTINPKLSDTQLNSLINDVEFFEDEAAVKHVF